jgi:cell division protein YceG involved in septum cleavage
LSIIIVLGQTLNRRVFLNRLEMEMMLQANPTVQSTLGQQPDED